jgi:hypothetical protein
VWLPNVTVLPTSVGISLGVTLNYSRNIPVSLDPSQDHFQSKDSGLHEKGNCLIPWTNSSCSLVAYLQIFRIKHLLHMLLTEKSLEENIV